jgi:hypothetical protein
MTTDKSALARAVQAARIDLQIARLRVLACETALEYGREELRQWLATSNSIAARIIRASLKGCND